MKTKLFLENLLNLYFFGAACFSVVGPMLLIFPELGYSIKNVIRGNSLGIDSRPYISRDIPLWEPYTVKIKAYRAQPPVFFYAKSFHFTHRKIV